MEDLKNSFGFARTIHILQYSIVPFMRNEEENKWENSVRMCLYPQNEKKIFKISFTVLSLSMFIFGSISWDFLNLLLWLASCRRKKKFHNRFFFDSTTGILLNASRNGAVSLLACIHTQFSFFFFVGSHFLRQNGLYCTHRF